MEQNQVNMWLSMNAKNFRQQDLDFIKNRLEAMPDDSVVYLQSASYKKPSTIFLIAFLFGWERFLLGSTGLGILKIMTGYGCGIWWLIDVITAKSRAKKYNLKQFQKAIAYIPFSESFEELVSAPTAENINAAVATTTEFELPVIEPPVEIITEPEPEAETPITPQPDILETDNTSQISNEDEPNKKTVKKSKFPVWIIIVLIVVLLGAGAAYYFLFYKEGESKKYSKDLMELLNNTSQIDNVINTIPIPSEITPTETITTISELQEVEQPVKEESPIVQQPLVEKSQQAESAKPTQQTSTSKSSGTVSVTGGKYTGELQNGKPHGMGTINYNSRTLIDSRDPKKRYAETGYTLTGEFYEGRLVQGQLSDEKGNQLERIIIGRGAY